ncbi:hypothetical protein HELRODRAFT_112224 [Helobdella robusta]|uniref:Protein kinase domain-containing protein n=1 Tax=Helobdella robusta TaxID=6412 RepID=T1EFH9_HELRO|nr:hypothetical protein HELRODRAFT_112224 [Helobdella robusta]ESO03300.1 hypothetical protein HELRODRAFT_112224 [Helobdella robusta]
MVSGAFAKNDYHLREDDDDFVDQANVMAGLDHANVLKLLGVSFKLKPMFIVTELFSCRNLKEALWNNDVDQNVCNLFSICFQITSAMAYLESQKFIIIRNLSAKSFVISNKATVKLINFTKARKVVDDSYVGDTSESVNVKRSSLEVLDGCNYSSKSDVWSAGVVMWEVFSEGEKPYIGLSPELIIRFVFQGGRLSKPALCPSDLFDVIHKCWLPQPKNRPSFQQLKLKLAGKSSVYLYPPQPFEKPSFSPDCPSFKSPPIGSRGKSVDRLGLVNTRVNVSVIIILDAILFFGFIK